MSMEPEGLATRVGDAIKQMGSPPLDQWHPELSGVMDMRIHRDGQWFYRNEPIKREAIVRLFSSILRREADGEFYLVTPVEKWRIQVDDAPLLAHSLEVSGEGRSQVMTLRTNVGEVLQLGSAHPLEVGSYEGSGEPRPVVWVRHGVEARLVTAAYYELAEHVVEECYEGRSVFGVYSAGEFFAIAEGG
ncbi:DUF1285 domain-containing protein [Marinobacter salinisoli]|uniref:DUF1285 domain-containing protein n=1 Tax=Marinobacter salinisoli TaxID=2769486 RepID=A0ABX7MQX9_9GAMM|nr:DUF1285 domain-containing protein [Marinobacter salinisoli]QSP93830.1 DUF1285 domain-containing protein [Marinobacter salinisoli]